MIQFFSKNTFLRYIVLFLLLLAVRTLYLLLFPDPFLSELHYQGVSTQLTNLGVSYRDVFHHLGPFSAGLFRLVYGEIGSSVWLSRAIALLVGFAQVVIVTSGLNQVNGLKDRNLFTGVIHIFLLHLFPDMILLSPILLGMTCMSLSYVLALRIIKSAQNQDVFLYLGYATALAGGFLFPMYLFAFPTLLIVVIYTSFNRRSIGLYLIGLVMPIMLVFAYFFLIGSSDSYLVTNLYYGFSVRWLSQFSVTYYMLVALVPGAAFAVAFFKIAANYNLMNYQQKMIASAVFYLITGLIIFVVLPEKSIHYYLLFVPFLVHFIAILIIETRNPKMANVLSLVFFGAIVLVSFLDRIPKVQQVVNYSPLYAREQIASYGKVLNLSDDKNILFNNSYAAGFCEYATARKYFLSHSNESSIAISEAFRKQMPDAIYDPGGVVKAKFRQLPLLEKQYIYFKTINIYRLRP